MPGDYSLSDVLKRMYTKGSARPETAVRSTRLYFTI